MGADYRFLFQSLVWSSLEGENKAVKQLFDDEHFTPQLAGKISEYIKTEEAQKDVSEMLNRDYDMDFATIPQGGKEAPALQSIALGTIINQVNTARGHTTSLSSIMKNKEHITKLGTPRTAILNALIMLRDDTLNYLQGEENPILKLQSQQQKG